MTKKRAATMVNRWKFEKKGPIIVTGTSDVPPTDQRNATPAPFHVIGETSSTISFQYPADAPKFERGKTYAWAVKTGGEWSEVNKFYCCKIQVIYVQIDHLLAIKLLWI